VAAVGILAMLALRPRLLRARLLGTRFGGADRFLVLMRLRLRLPLVRLEYVSVADEETMMELERIEGPALVLVAANVGSTRLIDNVVVVPLGMAVPEGLRELVG